MNQDEEPDDVAAKESEPMSRQEMMNDLMSFLTNITATDSSQSTAGSDASQSSNLTYDDCVNILRQAFEVGPENKLYHFAIFNTYKALKKSGMINLASFENRIGSRMSVDDSYELFGSPLAINKTDDNTVIYYAGSGEATPLRPYLLPDSSWYEIFNSKLQ